MRQAVIVSAVRTPVGKFAGGLSSLEPHELAAKVVAEAVRRAKIDPDRIDEVLYGTVMAKQMNNVARVVALEAGLPEHVPALSFDRQCATSLDQIAYASAMISCGMRDVMVTGGVDMDSRKPWVFGRIEQAFSLNPPFLLSPRVASNAYCDQANVLTTAEKIAKTFGITREECDIFSLESHRKAIAAWNDGRFDEQVLPIEIRDRKGNSSVVSRDEIMRENTMEGMAKLRIASGTEGGVVTAGNSSPLCDGASAVVVMEKSLADSLGCEILGRVSGYAAVGVDPTMMGIGPVYAIRKLMAQTNMTLDEIDLIELNEAFAAQSIACIRELNMDTQKLNVNGGAIALGHPLAATGGILIAKMLYELKRRDKHRGVISFCVAGGQGVAVLVER